MQGMVLSSAFVLDLPRGKATLQQEKHMVPVCECFAGFLAREAGSELQINNLFSID
jgi:hypothetical protein